MTQAQTVCLIMMVMVMLPLIMVEQTPMTGTQISTWELHTMTLQQIICMIMMAMVMVVKTYELEDFVAGFVSGTDCDDELTLCIMVLLIMSQTQHMEDNDGDGYGAEITVSYFAEKGSDCDDEDDVRNPSLDNDGDGVDSCIDCDDNDGIAWTSTIYYVDMDGDGFGSNYNRIDICPERGDELPEEEYGYVVDGDDCDDWDAELYAGRAYNETGNTCIYDWDGDGYGDIGWGGSDCDDWSSKTYPGQPSWIQRQNVCLTMMVMATEI